MKVRLNITKCLLCTEALKHCGRIVSHESWKFAPKYWKKILNIQQPLRKWELSQVIYISQWLENTKPWFSKLRGNPQKEAKLEMIASMKDLKKANDELVWTENLLVTWDESNSQVQLMSF